VGSGGGALVREVTRRPSEWRFLAGWSPDEIAQRLEDLRERPRNFAADALGELEAGTAGGVEDETMHIADEAVGPPAAGGIYERAMGHVYNYGFSDPSIVEGHFDAHAELLGRRMLLELKVLGLHYLCGVVVSDVRSSVGADESVFGFRYDTLEGHIERGAEWFRLSKDHVSGAVRFSIQSWWCEGDMPNWWSAFGFKVLAPIYRRRWIRRAGVRLRDAVTRRDR
jgi:uncharacterized protein (UPF0548 family)